MEGFECWSARELQGILDYKEWRNFQKVIQKAANACKNSGEEVNDHFVVVNKMIEIGKGGHREVEDVALTRYACYLIAHNRDPNKPAITLLKKT